MPQLKKSTKPFVLTDEVKNSGGFFVRTSGINLSEYNQNPVLDYDHDKTKLPIGNGMDLSVKGAQILFTPAFDPTDTFAESIYNKVENGTIRMSSASLKPPFEWSVDDAGNKWLEKSTLRAITITPFGANPKAMVQLHDEQDELIELNDDYFKTILKDTEMPNQINLTADALKVVNLSADATPDQYQEAVQNLVNLSETQAASIIELTAAKAEEVKKKDKALAKVIELELNEFNAFLDQAEKVDRKFTADQRPDFIELGYDTAKKIIDKMPSNPTVESRLAGGAGGGAPELISLSYDELSEQGKLVELMEKDFGTFNLKYKEKWGKDYPHQQ